ncbi:MAG: VOC family protein [Gemmatimonadetes bacterium]|nr:VOC family protein [Gemmatimonadota bacterium]MDE3259889.1 VOC family protein [Gemmatimonadota bacterium]
MGLLRHLALRCADMELSRRFYEEVIGWRFIAHRPHGDALDMSDGTNNITLIQQPKDSNRVPLGEGNEYIHFGVLVDDLDATWARIADWGAEVVRENVKERNPVDPDVRPPVSFKVLDPDGNIVDITCDRAEWVGTRVD